MFHMKRVKDNTILYIISDMTHEKMQEYNQLLGSQKVELTIVEYITEANSKLFQMDIDFVVELMDLVGKDDCCIPHELLYKYGVLTERDNSYDVKRVLEQYDFIEGKDYQLPTRNVAVPRNSDGTFVKITYMLHPDTFKKILIRCKNTYKYADYYLMLEKCVKYYNDYQIQLLKAKVSSICDDRVLKLANSNKRDVLMILKNHKHDDYHYCVIRCQYKTINSTLNKLKLKKMIT